MSLKVGFAGTPAFAAAALLRILEAGFSVPLVLSRPDKPKGRGLAQEASPVKHVAQARGLVVRQPVGLKDEVERNALLKTQLDVLVVAAYGLILPPSVLAWPRHGCLNIHASLLPRWRGAAPIQRAIEAGDRSSGVTIMQMDAGLDTGAMIETREIAIHPRETGGSLHDRLTALGADAIVDVLKRLSQDGSLHSTPQGVDATYAHKIEREDSRIDWTLDAATLDRRVRAFTPTPGSFTYLGGERLKVKTALPLDRERAAPGTVVGAGPAGIDVACGTGALRIVELQAAGKRAMSAEAFLAGRPISLGTHLGDPSPD
ncbi:MAG TPA: methionyl-tRNA formyltransferase [Casimicrobiaceae bacterium]|nr:methionyl-tRNA formyltransferase [Casimicrobiaceae bacterium]